MFPRAGDRAAMRAERVAAARGLRLRSAFALVAGPLSAPDAVAAGVVLSLMLEDLLLLSQHTHIPQSSQPRRTTVQPVPGDRTGTSSRDRCGCRAGRRRCCCTSTRTSCTTCIRSCPAITCGVFAYTPPNEIGWWRWIRAVEARRRRECSCFRTARETGLQRRFDSSIAARVRAVPPRRVRAGRLAQTAWFAAPLVAARSRPRSTAGATFRGRRLFGDQQDAARLRRDGAGHGRSLCARRARSPAMRRPAWPVCGRCRSRGYAARRVGRTRVHGSASCRTRSSSGSSASRLAQAPHRPDAAAWQFVADRARLRDRHAVRAEPGRADARGRRGRWSCSSARRSTGPSAS